MSDESSLLLRTAYSIVEEIKSCSCFSCETIWRRSNEERFFANSWLRADFHMWRNVKCKTKSPSEPLSPQANLSHTGVSALQNVRADVFSEHHDSIDRLVSLYGKINHQLRKYRQLKISLIRKRQAIAKAFDRIPDIKGRGSSSLVFSLETELLSFELDNIVQKKNEERKVAESTMSFDMDNVGIKVLKPKRSSSASAASLREGKKSVCFKDPNLRTDDRNRKAVKPLEPTIAKALSERILEELEVKLYNMKMMEIDMLRNRESEAAVVRSLLKSDWLVNSRSEAEREILGGEDTEKQKTKESYRHNNSKAMKEVEEYYRRWVRSPRQSSAPSDPPLRNQQTDLFQAPLKGYGEMAGELEDAVGSILKSKYLSKCEMMAIIDAVDIEWEEAYGHDNAQMKNSDRKHERNETQLRNDLSDPLFRSYQALLSHPILSKNQDLCTLREQHVGILRRTAALCEPYSPFEFVFHD